VKFLLPKNTRGSLSLNDAFAIVIVVMILVVVLAPFRNRDHATVRCGSNVKQLGLAFQIWAGDNDGRFPMTVYTNASGGPLLTRSSDAYRYFQVMSNEISNPKVLICPADKERTAATNFTSDFNNRHISYFVGLDADELHPRSILAGDGNLTNGSQSYDGNLEITTNHPARWTKERHAYGGNFVLTDGIFQQLDIDNLNRALQSTGLATNRLLIP
jgi:hypothetical protein